MRPARGWLRWATGHSLPRPGRGSPLARLRAQPLSGVAGREGAYQLTPFHHYERNRSARCYGPGPMIHGQLYVYLQRLHSLDYYFNSMTIWRPLRPGYGYHEILYDDYRVMS